MLSSQSMNYYTSEIKPRIEKKALEFDCPEDGCVLRNYPIRFLFDKQSHTHWLLKVTSLVISSVAVIELVDY